MVQKTVNHTREAYEYLKLKFITVISLSFTSSLVTRCREKKKRTSGAAFSCCYGGDDTSIGGSVTRWREQELNWRLCGGGARWRVYIHPPTHPHKNCIYWLHLEVQPRSTIPVTITIIQRQPPPLPPPIQPGSSIRHKQLTRIVVGQRVPGFERVNKSWRPATSCSLCAKRLLGPGTRASP